MSEGRWVSVKAITGGQVVVCRLCGKGFSRSFWATDTNYAEALRLAIAYASMHERSEEHAAGMGAFYSDPPERSAEEKLLDEIFNTPPRSQHELRREAARNAARGAVIERRRAEDRQRSTAAERRQAEVQEP